MNWRSTFVATVILPLAATSTPKDDQALIRAARQAQNAAIARRDYAAVAARWTEDVSVRAGLGHALNGRQAYRDAFVADSAMTYVRTPDSIVISSRWPLASERGHWIGNVRGSRPPITISGDYSAQWVKRGTDWLIRSELFVATTCTGQACEWPASPP